MVRLQKFGMADANAILLTCSGAFNVGQMSNQAVVALAEEGFGKFFCLAGSGAHLANSSNQPQIFFNPEGKEVYRHVGFMGEEAIVAQLKNMGVE